MMAHVSNCIKNHKLRRECKSVSFSINLIGMADGRKSSVSADYFNLIIGYDPFEKDHILVDPKRALTEYISDDVKERFDGWTPEKIAEIKKLPAIISCERDGTDEQQAVFAFIRDIKVQDNGIKVYFQSDDGRVDDKIVVIDDPVSSMDQQTLFYVSALTREMIAVCYNNFEMDEEKGADEHIRQFFCLTHNPVFFRDITYNRISQYECVTFFEITKDKDNHSQIEECWEEINATGGGYRINKSPVRNYYDSLWHELRTTDSPEMLMSVARQILEFFFLQTGGYKSAKLRDLLFEGDNKREFERQLADGSTDRTYYNIATSMIALLDVGVTNFNDGLFFDSSAFSVDQMKDAFAIIFDVMKQPQHYRLMMGIHE